jgi:Flp pilus assembly protein TadD
MKPSTRLVPLLLLTAAPAACEGGQPAERRPLGEAASASGTAPRLPPAVQAQLDSGNAAYRAGDYDAAQRHYREAARRGPDQAAAWFGVAMAAQKTGSRTLADSARARLRELSPAMSADVHHPGGTAPPESGAVPAPSSE